jgi:hypothetical protein
MADEKYRIVRFAEEDSVSEQDLLDFWQREDALGPELARERVPEVILVALDEANEVAAISSAYLARSERLGMDLWHYRNFVSSRHRQALLARQLTVQTTAHLRERFVSGEDVRGAGVVIVVESEILKAKNEAVWPASRFAFIGADASYHYRVQYFPGARVPTPSSY